MGLLGDFVLLAYFDALHQPQEGGTIQFLKLGIITDDGQPFVGGLLVLLLWYTKVVTVGSDKV